MGKIKKSSSVFVFAKILLVSLVSALEPGRAFGRQTPNAYELLRRQRTSDAGSVQKDAGAGQTRAVHFPPDRSLGQLLIQDANSIRKLAYWFHWTGNGESRREYLCEAQGDVQVPAGKRLCLEICSRAVGDLVALERLGPDDLYSIGCPPASPEQAPPRITLCSISPV